MTYLVDTNIISEVMRKRPDPQVDAWFRMQQQIVTSAVCIEELVFGLRRRSAFAKEAWLRSMLADVGMIHPVTDSAAQWAGAQRARLERTMPDTLRETRSESESGSAGMIIVASVV